jgi:hypothetical protein
MTVPTVNPASRRHLRHATTHKDIGSPQGMPNPQLLDYQVRQLTVYLLNLRKRP